MQKESMKKELLFRKQREEQLEMNLRRVSGELHRALQEQSDLNMGINSDQGATLKEENKRLKEVVEELRREAREA